MVGLERGTVELVEHDPAWREAYHHEVERLRSLAEDRFLGFEHVGSTAVEGLPAKPVIDLVGLVEDRGAGEELVGVLEAHGYERRPDEAVPGRIFLAKGPASNRTHYLSVTELGSEFHRETVAFRDYLREHSAAAAEYADLKRRLAAEYPGDREAYTAGKGEFVERILHLATDP